MSVRALTLVQERTRAKGSNLHALGVIADYAKDDGKWAWPRPSTIAWKMRLTPRAAELIIRKLVDDGEILPAWNAAEKRLYLHIRCVFDWEAYRAEGALPEREKSSRNTSESFALRLVELAAASAKSRAANANSDADQREVSCEEREISCAKNAATTSGGEGSPSQPLDPSLDPSGIEQGAAPLATKGGERTPEENLAVVTKLAHEVLDLYALTPDVTERDVVVGIELRCRPGAYDIATTRDVVYRAIESAVYQRRRAGKTPVLKNSPGDSAFRMQTAGAHP